jgi:aryl-alcohol dehydrogenase-like predicted oxidoreductase
MALGVDHLDLYQIHGFDPATPMEERLRALGDHEASGTIDQQWLESTFLQKQASI